MASRFKANLFAPREYSTSVRLLSALEQRSLVPCPRHGERHDPASTTTQRALRAYTVVQDLPR
jgi:hypothetical protein